MYISVRKWQFNFRNLESRHVKSRPITVDDLEARPGSPSMLYVASSESGTDNPIHQHFQKVSTDIFYVVSIKRICCREFHHPSKSVREKHKENFLSLFILNYTLKF